MLRRLRRIFRKNSIVVWLNARGALRLASGVVALLLLVVLLTQDIPSSRTWTYWTLPLSGKTIAIDAGHGGIDGGAVSRSGLVEKDLNLAVAYYLRDYLQEAGALVLLTREGDYDLAEPDTRVIRRRKTEDLIKRVQTIREARPDLAISVHMNSIPQARWSGAQTFFYPNHPDNEPLALLIQEEIRRNMENTTRTAAKVESVYLLKTLKEMPVVLVEVGFLSNPPEAGRLGDKIYQQAMAASIYEGILRFVAGERPRPQVQ